jgi:hypothetical protein
MGVPRGFTSFLLVGTQSTGNMLIVVQLIFDQELMQISA